MRFLLALVTSALLLSAPAAAQMNMLTGAGGKFRAGSAAGPMTTPIFAAAGPTSTGPSATVASYGALLLSGPVNLWTTNTTARQGMMPVAGSITDLNVRYPSGGSYTVALVKNGNVSTNVTCVTSGGPPATCTASGVETIAAGDRVQWVSCPGTFSGNTCSNSASTSNAEVQISATFTSSSNNEGFLYSSGSTASASNAAVSYMNFGGTNTYQSSEVLSETVIPTAGVIDKLNIYNSSQNVPGSGKFWIMTLFKNGTATSLQCSMTGTVAGAGVTQCTDSSNSVSVSAGDTVSIEICPQSSGVYSGSCSVGGTPLASIFLASARWVPTVAGESVFTTAFNLAPATNATRWTSMSGAIAGYATESQPYSIVPRALTVKKLYVQQQPQPGAGVTRTYTFRSGAASKSVACTVAAGTGATGTCNDSSNSYSAAASELIDWQLSVSGANSAITSMTISGVATVP